MKPELQQEAIAKYCGCRKIHGAEIYQWSWMSSDDIGANELPDYLNDLNAMHEAEKVLKEPEQQEAFSRCLFGVLDGAWVFKDTVPDNWYRVFDNIHATAAQRAEAFIRTLGIWVEEKTKL